MAKKKQDSLTKPTPPEPFPLNGLEEPFHAEQCAGCLHYSTGRYLAAPEDLGLALAGQRVHMGICHAMRKFLVTATKEPCDRFFAKPPPAEPKNIKRDGSGEYVLR